MKRFKEKVSGKAFAREVLAGVLALSCFFAIFLYVALQKSTGKSISPLSYLWPDKENAKEDLIPVVVFENEQDRIAARAEYQSALPALDKVVGKFKASADELVEKRKQREQRKFHQDRTRSGSAGILVANANQKPPSSFHDSNESSFSPGTLPVVQTRGSSSAQLRSQPPNQFHSAPVSNPPRDTFAAQAKSQPLPLRQVNQLPSIAKSGKAFHEPDPSQFRADQAIPVTKSKPQQASFVEPVDSQTSDQSRFSSESRDRKTGSRPNIQWLAEARQKALRVEPQRDDSFWSLSEEYYGDGKHFAALAIFNGCANDVDDLPAMVLIPTLGEIKRMTSTNSTAKDTAGISLEKVDQDSTLTFTTRGGENLFEIARDKIGSGAEFVKILKANRLRLPANCDAQTRLPKGIRLTLPGPAGDRK